jgi:hypothetical protein
MSDKMQCFSIEELEPLDEHQLALLRFAIEREVRNSPEVKRILRASVQPIYDRMLLQRRRE